MVIPNKDVIQNPLKNFSSSQERRVTIECGVSYGDSLEKVRSVAIKAIRTREHVNQDKPIDFLYTELGDSSIHFHIRYWLVNPSNNAVLLVLLAGTT